MYKQATPYGKKIKKALIDKGITQRKLSQELGIHYKYLTDIIYGNRSGKKYYSKIKDTLNIQPPNV